MSSPKKVCVVGAGTAGLVTVKECLQGGLLPTCYDMDSHIGFFLYFQLLRCGVTLMWHQYDRIVFMEAGGVWHQKPDSANSNTPMVWNHLVTNNPKNCTAFSDFPFPPEQTPYMTWRDMFKYMEDYANHFGLNDYISLNTEVVKVHRAENFSVTGQWVVYTRPAESPKAQNDTKKDLATCKREIFDAVFICSGFLRRPKYADIAGINTFTGKSLHSFHYNNPQQMEGKTVLIIGNSFSAIDVAENVATKANQIILAVGKGTWILPRINQNGIPFFETVTRDAFYASNAEQRLNKLFIESSMKRLDHDKIKLRPSKPPLNAALAFGEIIQLHILSGKVKIYGYVKSINGSQVVFDDGSVVDDVEIIIYSTGFNTHLDFVEDDIVQKNGRLNLYNMIFPLNRKHNTLACIAILGVDMAFAPVAENQARYAVKIITEQLKLPPQSIMERNIDMLNGTQLQRKGNYHYSLSAILLNELIATDLGVQPSFWKIFFRDPLLAYRVWYGPCYSCHYRLIGPGSNWKEARANSHRAYEERGAIPKVHKNLEPLNKFESSTGSLAKWIIWGFLALALGKLLKQTMGGLL